MSIAGCEQPGPVQPKLSALMAGASHDASGSGKPDVDPTYANGKTVYMLGPHLIVNARETQPNLYAKAEELYLVVYPQQVVPSPGVPPITLPSGYQPQCNPCFHPGLPAPFVFHDHVITGAPGNGKERYSRRIQGALEGHFADLQSGVRVVTHLRADQERGRPRRGGAGGQCVSADQSVGAANQYEIETGNVLICPIVSSKA